MPKGEMSGSGLTGKVAWITGGGSGIGLAGAIEFQKLGATVVISGRTQSTLADALKQVKAESVVCDVAQKDQVAKAAAEILKRHGRIDVLVNSAGINSPKRSFGDVSNDVWDQMSHAQAEGDLWCARQAGDIVQDYDTTDREGNPLRVVLVVQSLIIDHPDLGGVYEFTC